MDEKLTKTIFNKAVQLLAQRDHSSYELSQKLSLFLSQKMEAKIETEEDQTEQDNNNFSEQIAQVIEYCIAHHWLDDAQYTEKYIGIRSRKGYGKYKIVLELKQRGLSSDMINSVLHQIDIDWIDVAAYQITKKFKKIDKKDLSQKKKIIQFLLYRGFAQDEIKTAYLSLT